MRTRLLAAAAAAGLGAACSVSINDYLGRHCDQDHACVDGWFCVAGVCQPDAGAPADAGVVWRQWVEGFVATGVSPGNCCALDAGSAADGNLVTATAPSPGSATATGAFAMDSNAGQFRGHLTANRALATDARGLFASVKNNQGADFLTLQFVGNGTITVLNPAGTLQATEVNELDTLPGFAPGTEYLIEVAWQRGGFRTTQINGAVVASHTLTPLASAPSLTSVSLGLVTDAGLPGDFGVTLQRWQLGRDPAATLSEN